MARFREEVLNVVLAQLLDERGVVSLPEQIEKWSGGPRLPDVLIEFQGLRTIIEGKIAAADAPVQAPSGGAVPRQMIIPMVATAALTVLLGVVPGPVLTLARASLP